jgi:hypothetical protein
MLMKKRSLVLLFTSFVLISAGLSGCSSHPTAPPDYAANFKPKPLPPGEMAKQMQSYAAHVAETRKKMGLDPGPGVPGVPNSAPAAPGGPPPAPAKP